MNDTTVKIVQTSERETVVYVSAKYPDLMFKKYVTFCRKMNEMMAMWIIFLFDVGN